MSIADRIGWLGATCLALCGLPEAYSAITTGSTGLSGAFLSLWGAGEVLALIYTILKSKQISLLPLIFNYGLNLVFISIIGWTKIWG